MFDIDHFKRANDIYGHLKGDEVLCTLVSESQRQLRDNDQLARWGGEEFMVLLPETALMGAEQIAERVRAKVELATILPKGSLTISLGVIEFFPNEDLIDVLEKLDQAMCRAKDSGRNQVCSAPADNRQNTSVSSEKWKLK
jgi:diguanylate cyclase (GGDEF)-like protein